MATKKNEIKQETLFTKEQILVSEKYANKKDVCKTVIPENFHGTLNEADILIKKFYERKVK